MENTIISIKGSCKAKDFKKQFTELTGKEETPTPQSISEELYIEQQQEQQRRELLKESFKSILKSEDVYYIGGF